MHFFSGAFVPTVCAFLIASLVFIRIGGLWRFGFLPCKIFVLNSIMTGVYLFGINRIYMGLSRLHLFRRRRNLTIITNSSSRLTAVLRCFGMSILLVNQESSMGVSRGVHTCLDNLPYLYDILAAPKTRILASLRWKLQLRPSPLFTTSRTISFMSHKTFGMERTMVIVVKQCKHTPIKRRMRPQV